MKTPAILMTGLLLILTGSRPMPQHVDNLNGDWWLQINIPSSSAWGCMTGRITDNQSYYGVPLLEEKLDPGQNTVYSPAFRAAWTMLVTDILGEYVKTVNPIPLVEKMNLQPFRPGNPSDWVIEAGTVEDGIIERIKQSLMHRFNETDLSLEKFRSENDAIICYARLVKVMSFKYPFESLEWNFNTDKNTSKVACFGISKKRFNEDEDIAAMQQQVSIYDYRNPDDFIVSLSTSDPSVEIILAKVYPGETIEETMTKVDERMKRSIPEDFSNIDEIIIPKLNLESIRNFDELIHQFLANKGFEDYFFTEAFQKVDFILDESGALAKVTGEIVKIKGPESRIYAFDRPFLVICRERQSTEPDLVAWVADTGAMQILH